MGKARRGGWYSRQSTTSYTNNWKYSLWARPSTGPINTVVYAPGLSSSASITNGFTNNYRAALVKGNGVTPYPTFAGSTTSFTRALFDQENYPPQFGSPEHPKRISVGGVHGISQLNSFQFDRVSYAHNLQTVAAVRSPYVSMSISLAEVAQSNNELLGELNNGAMEILVSLAEAKKTMRTLASNAERLLGITAEIVSAKPDKYLKSIGIIPNNDSKSFFNKKRLAKWPKDRPSAVRELMGRYMEARFGILPILYDIDGAAQIIAGYDGTAIRGSVRSVKDYELDQEIEIVGVPGVKGTRKLSGNLKYVRRIAVQLYSDFENNANRIGLSATNIASSTWELVPYSWLIDKFLDIGAYTRALGGIRAWKYLHGSTSFKAEFQVDTEFEQNIGGYRVRRGQIIHKGSAFRRTVQSGFPLPELPSFRMDLGIRDKLDILGLLTPRILKGKEKYLYYK